MATSPVSAAALTETQGRRVKFIAAEEERRSFVAAEASSGGMSEDKYSSYGEMIEHKSVDQKLFMYGYIPKQKVYITDKQGEKVKFIKTVNKFGFCVYVIPDMVGFTNIECEDLSMVAVAKGELVPHSVKLGARKCIGNEVCGVAMECGEGGICALTHEGDVAEFREETFLYREENVRRTITELDKIIPYPVVKLSEIEANPSLVLNNTMVVTKRLRENAFCACREETAHFLSKAEELVCMIKEFIKLRDAQHDALGENLHKLRTAIDACREPSTMKEKERLCKIMYNIEVRETMLVELLKCCKLICKESPKLTCIIDSICACNTHISEDLSKVNASFRPTKDTIYKEAIFESRHISTYAD